MLIYRKYVISLWLSNCITEIDELAFAPFKSLAKLNLQSNNISKISRTAFSGTKLTHLYLSTNKLKCVPDLYTVSQTLIHLDISKNEIENDQGPEIIYIFPKLKTIILDYNDLHMLPGIVSAADYISELHLNHNSWTT